MDRLHQMTVFVAVAEGEGFAAAARRLNMSPPAVTRAIAALEDHLGVKLLYRTTRYVRTTDAGARYLEDARRILADVQAADAAAAGVNVAPRGQLAITAPVLFGRMHVTPVITEYLALYPETQVTGMFVDRVVNMLEEGLDVGVRIGSLADSSMRAVRVGAVRLVLCASPQYLERAGAPRSLEDLCEHSMIGSLAGSRAFDWRFATESGPRVVGVEPRLALTTNDAVLEAAVRGFGICRVLSYQAAALVSEGKLSVLLPEHEPPERPVHVLHREAPLGSAKVRAFVDLLVARLRATPSLQW